VSAGPTEGLPARRAALVAIARVEEEGAWSTRAVPEAIAHLASQRDRAFAAHLAHDTLRWDGTLRWLLAQVLTRPFDDVEVAVGRVLRLGALQLFRSGVPARAAVDTSVRLSREAVPKQRADGAARFVNGVLRNLGRRLDTGITWPDEPRQSLALRTGHPAWVVADLLGRVENADLLLEADNEPPGLTLRANGDADELVAELAAAGIDAVALGEPAEAVTARGIDPRQLAAVAQGRAVPQDAASMLVSHATGVAPGDRVLDLCAGPGGKATHLAHLVGPLGRVTAVELHRHRGDLIAGAARRQGVEVDVIVGDAREVALDPDGYDVVLLDAPCSGLGVGRRRPEVRWRATPTAVSDLARLQSQLLARAATLVRPGGRLTYAVCTWTAAETDRVVDGVMGDGFTEVSRVQLRPDRDGTDAMFVASWLRDV